MLKGMKMILDMFKGSFIRRDFDNQGWGMLIGLIRYKKTKESLWSK